MPGSVEISVTPENVHFFIVNEVFRNLAGAFGQFLRVICKGLVAPGVILFS